MSQEHLSKAVFNVPVRAMVSQGLGRSDRECLILAIVATYGHKWPWSHKWPSWPVMAAGGPLSGPRGVDHSHSCSLWCTTFLLLYYARYIFSKALEPSVERCNSLCTLIRARCVYEP